MPQNPCLFFLGPLPTASSPYKYPKWYGRLVTLLGDPVSCVFAEIECDETLQN